MLSDAFPAHEALDAPPAFYVAAPDSDPASEYDRQRAIVAACRSRGLFVAHIPQSGRRSDWERLNLHRSGAISGLPDLWIIWSGGHYLAEVKDGRGKPSKAQIAVMNRLTALGVACGVHRGWATLAEKLIEAGAPIAEVRDAV